jgi:hypothetical protein
MRKHHRQLDISVGMSGPHDFAVRVGAARLAAPSASTASRPAFVTIASRPSKKDGTGQVRKGDLPDGASAYFRITAGRPNQLESIFEFAFLAQL